MEILADYGHPYVIDSVTSPITPRYCWFYDIELNDLLLRPINLLEETSGEVVLVKINNKEFYIPVSWNLLIIDEDTKLVDTVQITKCGSSNYKALLLHPDESAYQTEPVVLLDLLPYESCSHVMIPKQHMMLHPVGQIKKSNVKRVNVNYSCLLTPQDLGKYFHGLTAMEILV